MMKVVYTDQAIASLEESLNFAIAEQGIPTHQIISIVNRLFERADNN